MLAAAYDYNPIASASGLLSALFGRESCENVRFPGFSGGFCPTSTDSVCIKDSVRIDPCAGSGHICAYLFDVLMQIYQDYGYNARDSVRSIIENNLYGLDIDERATQLTYFSVMMKAVQYDARFLRRNDIPQPHVYAIAESNQIQYKNEFGDFLLVEEHRETLRYLLDVFQDAKEYGSILNIEQREYVGFLEAWESCAEATLENVMMVGWYIEAKDILKGMGATGTNETKQ